MKIFILMLLLSVNCYGQGDVLSLLTTFNNGHRDNFIPSNYIEKSYTITKEDDFTKSINIDGNEFNLLHQVSDTVEWIENTRISRLTVNDSSHVVTVMLFNSEGQMKSSKKTYDDYELMNEDRIMMYNSDNRLIAMYNRNEETTPLFKIEYKNNDFFPEMIEGNIGLKFIFRKEMKGDTIIYRQELVLPEDLKRRVLESLGEDATEEDILEALGPFGKRIKDYIVIYKNEDGLFNETVYKVDDDGQETLEKSLLYNKDFVLLREEDEYSITEYAYNANGKVMSTTINGITSQNEFDDEGNMTKELLGEKVIIYEYTNNRLSHKYIYFGSSLFNYVEFAYLD